MYTKTTWLARVGTALNRFLKTNELAGSVELTNDPTGVTTGGTPFTVDNMNKIETGIKELSDVIDSDQDGTNNAILNKVTANTYNGFTGMISPFAVATPQTGWLECNGVAVSRATYSLLFAVIGVVFGTGDGSTTFNVPDLRGEFLRGHDHGRGVDTGRAFGSSQVDQMEAHDHSYPGSGGSGVFVTLSGGSATYGAKASSSTGGTSNSSENRPRNIAILYCIKY